MAIYTIEIANRIRHGRCVATDYVVTRRPDNFTGIIATFATREEAVAFIASARTTPVEPWLTEGGR